MGRKQKRIRQKEQQEKAEEQKRGYRKVGSNLKALRFQTEERHQKSPASIRGGSTRNKFRSSPLLDSGPFVGSQPTTYNLSEALEDIRYRCILFNWKIRNGGFFFALQVTTVKLWKLFLKKMRCVHIALTRSCKKPRRSNNGGWVLLVFKPPTYCISNPSDESHFFHPKRHPYPIPIPVITVESSPTPCN